MKRLVLYSLLSLSLFLAFIVTATYFTAPTQKLPCVQTRWAGSTDDDMLKQVRADLVKATAPGCIRVELMSPGGPVVTSLEIARTVRNASRAGVLVEIHGSGIVASGGTFVLSSGTPGLRYIAKGTLVVVHSIQIGGGWGGGQSCVEFNPTPKTENEKVVNELLRVMAQAYAEYTGRPVWLTATWFKCGEERVGSERLALKLGLADKAER